LSHWRRREISLEGITGVSVTAGDSRHSIDAAIAQYLADTAVQKEPRTLAAYRIALTQFRESCAKTYLEELERRDLLNFVAFLRKSRKKNGELFGDRTVYNRFENIVTFLKEYGVKGIVLHKDWPQYDEEDAVPYTQDELSRLFAAADGEQFVSCQFFLKTGAATRKSFSPRGRISTLNPSCLASRRKGRGIQAEESRSAAYPTARRHD
jgi:hypothetical protein